MLPTNVENSNVTSGSCPKPSLASNPKPMIVVADPGGEAAGALPVLRGQRQHAVLEALLSRGAASGPEVAEPTQPATLVPPGRLLRVFEALPAAAAPQPRIVHDPYTLSPVK